MKHAKDYQVVLSDEKIPIFIFDHNKNKVINPVILYDGGKHATLFRNEKDVILVDYLPLEIQKILSKIDWCVAMEKDTNGEHIAKDYKLPIKHIKSNPFTDNI